MRDFPYREQRLGNALLISGVGLLGRTYHIRDGEICLKSLSSSQTTLPTTSQHLLISPMSSSTRRQQNARRRATELARPNSPLIFNQEHYSVCVIIDGVIDKLTKYSLPV